MTLQAGFRDSDFRARGSSFTLQSILPSERQLIHTDPHHICGLYWNSKDTAMVSGTAKSASQIESGDLLVASNGTCSLFRSILASIVSAALIASLIMLGSCYRENMQLQQRLLGAHPVRSMPVPG